MGTKTETDYRITKAGWLEIGGCGMVILMFLKLWYQPDEYNGFAFGMG
jgi:phenylalanyl-tRNA synthetase alpha subunit